MTTISIESTHLIKTNKWKCEEIFTKGNYSENNIIDTLISLHLILEISINGLFRAISNPVFQKNIDILECMNKIDNINFIDKITMFIYFGNFDFSDTENFKNRLDGAIKYHKIIGTLKDFANIRNSLLHGHALHTITDLSTSLEIKTKTQAKLNKDFLDGQIKKFEFIMEGISFYLDCYEKEKIPLESKIGIFKAYLDKSFLYKYFKN